MRATADPTELKRKALSLINGQSTMTLATARGGIAWAAPVYYVLQKGVFFFFSNPRSRHITEALESRQVSATIYAHADTWQGIRGIQMEGCVRGAGVGPTAVAAVRAYLAKFPFTKAFFKPDQALDLENFGKRFRVKLYRLDPTTVYYLDNSIQFGFREMIYLSA